MDLLFRAINVQLTCRRVTGLLVFPFKMDALLQTKKKHDTSVSLRARLV